MTVCWLFVFFFTGRDQACPGFRTASIARRNRTERIAGVPFLGQQNLDRIRHAWTRLAQALGCAPKELRCKCLGLLMWRGWRRWVQGSSRWLGGGIQSTYLRLYILKTSWNHPGKMIEPKGGVCFPTQNHRPQEVQKFTSTIGSTTPSETGNQANCLQSCHLPQKRSLSALYGCDMQWMEEILHQLIDVLGYGACRSAALSAFLKVDNRHSFFIFMRDAIVKLCYCAFYKTFLTDPIGSSQELTLRTTIAILGSVSSRQLLFHVHFISLKREYVGCMISNEDVTTYQERLASYFAEMLQRIRNVLQVAWRRCYNVSGTSCKLLEEDVTMYQERLASYLRKMLQCIRLTTQTTGRCYTPQTPPKKKKCAKVTTVPPLHGRRTMFYPIIYYRVSKI